MLFAALATSSLHAASFTSLAAVDRATWLGPFVVGNALQCCGSMMLRQNNAYVPQQQV
jgi:hypothetical protein